MRPQRRGTYSLRKERGKGQSKKFSDCLVCILKMEKELPGRKDWERNFQAGKEHVQRDIEREHVHLEPRVCTGWKRG